MDKNINEAQEPCTIHSVTCRLSVAEVKQGFFIKNGQKTTSAIEQICTESELNIQPQNDYF